MYCEHGVVSDVEVIRPMTTQEPLVLRGRIWTGAGAAHALVEDGVIEGTRASELSAFIPGF